MTKATTKALSATDAPSAAAPRTAADWERIELDYRAGIKTLRQIGEEHGITHGAINKRAKRDGWERDLSQKIHAKAEALVSKAAVSNEVSKESRAAEKQVIEVNAQAVATVRLGQREDVQRARRLCMSLLQELEQQTENVPELHELGELLRSEDERGQDKRNDIYLAVIGLPERTKTMKALAEAMRVLIALERQAYGIKEEGELEAGSIGGGRELTDAERAVRLARVLASNPGALSALTGGGEL